MLSTHPLNNSGERNKGILKFALFALIAVYLVDCFTPLRLHYDSVRYFAIKDCIESGCPPDSDAAKDYFPFGYTANLLVLSKLGILSSFTIVLTNFLFLLGGLYFITKAFKKRFSPYLLFVVVLLNWLFIKFVTHPLSEMQYVFFSMGCIYFFYRFTEARKIVYLLLSLLFCWLAFVTKTVGISLVGAIALGIIWEFRAQMTFLKKYKILIAIVLIAIGAGVVIFSKQLGINHYIGVLETHLNEAPFFKRLQWRFTEWGEIFLNMPANKAVDRLHTAGEILFIATGVVIFFWFCMVMFAKRSAIPFLIKAYFVFYCIIMFSWPFFDPRFWVPVMPVMAAVVLQAPFRSSIMKLFSRVLLVIYIVLGSVAAGYMIYSSFNKSYFAKNQANGSYKNDYETHFFSPLPEAEVNVINSSDTMRVIRTGDSSKVVNPYILSLLHRYSKVR
jgi:hypothetical protein